MKIIPIGVIGIIGIIVASIIYTQDYESEQLQGKDGYFRQLTKQDLEKFYSDQNMKNIIYWHERKLTIYDFLGDDREGASEKTVAESHVALSPPAIIPDYLKEEPCRYKIIEIETYAIFDINTSWMKDIAKNESTLKHEQLHFDIYEVYARILKEQLDEQYLGKIYSCPDVREDLLGYSILSRIFDDIIRPNWEPLMIEASELNENKYDADVRKNPERQQFWNENVENCFNKKWQKIKDCLEFTKLIDV